MDGAGPETPGRPTADRTQIRTHAPDPTSRLRENRPSRPVFFCRQPRLDSNGVIRRTQGKVEVTKGSKFALLLLLPACLATGPLFAAQGAAQNQATGPGAQAATAPATGVMTPAERDALILGFKAKWGNYVARFYKVPPDVWSERMASTFASADPANLRRALERDTFEGAMSELYGMGHRVSDLEVIDLLAASAADGGSDIGIQSIGSLTKDLTFTPLQPCRIADTRVANGAIPANSSRSFYAISDADYPAQGGALHTCSVPGSGVGALALNVTVVSPSANGYATVYAYGRERPPTSSINYTAGAIVNNTIITAIPNPPNIADLEIYTFADAHFVVDVVGFFAPPLTTALECTGTYVGQSVAANATFDIQLPACPATYTLMGAGCRSRGYDDLVNWNITGLNRTNAGEPLTAYCSGTNKSAFSVIISGTTNCCRVPGR